MGISTFVDFQIADGRATALTVPWAPDERWERKKAEAAPPAARLEPAGKGSTQ